MSLNNIAVKDEEFLSKDVNVMIILVGECGCGKSAIEKVLIEKYGYERAVSYTSKQKEQYKKNTVCVLTPHRLKQLKNNLDKDELDMHIFYIKVPRKDRLIKMFQRGDDIDEAIERDRVDTSQYDGIEKQVNYVLNNANYLSDPENMAYWISECINKGSLW